MSNVQVYPGPYDDMVRRIAELERRVRDLEYAPSVIGTRDESLPLRVEETSIPHIENATFRIGDRCGVYTGGQPCVKVGTVETREHDGRWLVKLDRAGRIKATDEDMVWLPESWVE